MAKGKTGMGRGLTLEMNIQEKTRQALSELFSEPPTPPAIEEPDDTGEGEKTKKPEPPRENGVIDQDYKSRGFHIDVQCGPDQLVRITEILFELGYFIESITGVDWIKEDKLEVVYDYCRYDFDLCRVAIRVKIPRPEPHLPTITNIFTGANWHERETHDFFGIIFDGHPNLIPLLLPEDADFHPLLKDFKA